MQSLILSFIITILIAESVQGQGIVKREGIKFKLDGKNYYFAGTSSYDLFTMSMKDIDARMADMYTDGVRVVRTSAFSHEDWHGFETRKGYFAEEEFKLFDYVMKSARDHQIRVIIMLEDYWGSYGGIVTRLKWEGLSGSTHKDKAKFYTNEGCKAGYKGFLKHFMTRVNNYTKVAYKDDPYLFSWELMNEPRYMDSGEDETGITLRKWADEMASYIKSLDPNHMVSLGIEGHGKKYGYGGSEGNPFVYLHQSPYIDFATAHIYPDEDWAKLSPSDAAKVVTLWVYDAQKLCGKPFVLEEYNSRTRQAEYWNAMLIALETVDGNGDCFWGYEPCSPECAFCICHGHPVIAAAFKPHADRVNNKH